MKLVGIEKIAESAGKSLYTVNERRRIMGIKIYCNRGKYVTLDDCRALAECFGVGGEILEDVETGDLHTEEDVLRRLCCSRSAFKDYCRYAGVARGWLVSGSRHYTDEEIGKIEDAMRRRPPSTRARRRRIWYKVAVFDSGLPGWVVRHCSLTRAKAESMVDEYASCGEMARCSPHVRTAVC